MSLVYKFCNATVGESIIETKRLYITSPLDLNDPFEMRPAWTEHHEKRSHEEQLARNQSISPLPTNKPDLTSVDQHRGVADIRNQKAFALLHKKYRVLSFATGIMDPNHPTGSNESNTLLWAHYADSFQGVCLGFDSGKFDTGIKAGGFPVAYDLSRKSFAPSFYDAHPSVNCNIIKDSGRIFHQDPEGGLYLTESEFQEIETDRVLAFLTSKSPAWAYEKEVRMIYDLDKFRSSPNYVKCTSCRECKIQNKLQCDCDSATYNDAVTLPATALQSVLFGTDISISGVSAIWNLLEDPSYNHVKIYWSSLHSDRYELQYNLDERPSSKRYSKGIQKLQSESVSLAKGHIKKNNSGQFHYIPSKKGQNYITYRTGSC